MHVGRRQGKPAALGTGGKGSGGGSGGSGLTGDDNLRKIHLARKEEMTRTSRRCVGMVHNNACAMLA